MDTVYLAVSAGPEGAVTFLDPDGRMEHHFLAREDRGGFFESARRVKRAWNAAGCR